MWGLLELFPKHPQHPDCLSRVHVDLPVFLEGPSLFPVPAVMVGYLRDGGGCGVWKGEVVVGGH